MSSLEEDQPLILIPESLFSVLKPIPIMHCLIWNLIFSELNPLLFSLILNPTPVELGAKPVVSCTNDYLSKSVNNKIMKFESPITPVEAYHLQLGATTGSGRVLPPRSRWKRRSNKLSLLTLNLHIYPFLHLLASL